MSGCYAHSKHSQAPPKGDRRLHLKRYTGYYKSKNKITSTKEPLKGAFQVHKEPADVTWSKWSKEMKKWFSPEELEEILKVRSKLDYDKYCMNVLQNGS